jgi:hypothetical protein
MKNRPYFLRHLGLLHLLCPIFQAGLLLLLMPEYLNVETLFSGPMFKVIPPWLIFPISGLLLLSAFNWSFIFFSLFQLWALQDFLRIDLSQISSYEASLFGPQLFIFILNLFFTIFFTFPLLKKWTFLKTLFKGNKEPFYLLPSLCTLYVSNPNEVHDCQLLGLSESEATISLDKDLDIERVVHFNISYDQIHLSLRAKTEKKISKGKLEGFKLKFLHDTVLNYLQARILAFKLKVTTQNFKSPKGRKKNTHNSLAA